MSWTLAVSSKRSDPRPGQLSQQIVGVPGSAISLGAEPPPELQPAEPPRHTFPPLLVAKTCVPEKSKGRGVSHSNSPAPVFRECSGMELACCRPGELTIFK